MPTKGKKGLQTPDPYPGGVEDTVVRPSPSYSWGTAPYQTVSLSLNSPLPGMLISNPPFISTPLTPTSDACGQLNPQPSVQSLNPPVIREKGLMGPGLDKFPEGDQRPFISFHLPYGEGLGYIPRGSQDPDFHSHDFVYDEFVNPGREGSNHEGDPPIGTGDRVKPGHNDNPEASSSSTTLFLPSAAHGIKRRCNMIRGSPQFMAVEGPPPPQDPEEQATNALMVRPPNAVVEANNADPFNLSPSFTWVVPPAPQQFFPIHAPPRMELELVVPTQLTQVLADLASSEGPPRLQALLQHSFQQVKLRLEELEKGGRIQSEAINQIFEVLGEHENLIKGRVSSFLQQIGERLSKISGLDDWAEKVKSTLDTHTQEIRDCQSGVTKTQGTVTNACDLLRKTRDELSQHVDFAATAMLMLQEQRTVCEGGQGRDVAKIQELREQVDRLRERGGSTSRTQARQ